MVKVDVLTPVDVILLELCYAKAYKESYSELTLPDVNASTAEVDVESREEMPALENIRHEAFAQNLVSGLSLGKAYVLAGYQKAGASANAARLLRNGTVSSRVAELRAEIESAFIDLQITEREQRLKAKQWVWDLLREAILFRAIGDYPKMMATGIVSRKWRAVGTGAKQGGVRNRPRGS
jgi:hypothetical protein